MTTLSRTPSARPAPARRSARALTVGSAAGLVLLPPTVLVAWILVLSTERGTQCLMTSGQCSHVPGGLLWACFWTSVALGVLALFWPRARWVSARRAAVFLQWGAQLTLGLLILAGA
ncbi:MULTISPECIES: hypothetical protein [Streptomyces]|uniref:Transmembrane protein n=1 Tax=Streptomyces lienomycini TaxID=284035 RepID=A0ABV9WS21_9ACTN|nr:MULTISPECIES: hypothetical protein [Streptomyces]